jgi:DNA-nicking Smr family endonuclease
MARKLGADEQKLWGRVIDTVRPFHKQVIDNKPKILNSPSRVQPAKTARPAMPNVVGLVPSARNFRKLPNPQPVSISPALDGHWDRRIHKGLVSPDISIDLHGTALSGAYARLDGALEMAIAQRLKVVLLVTGKIRAHDRASGSGRGAIAAVVRDWISASRHARHISAIRTAHPRHGGDGALYILLKR